MIIFLKLLVNNKIISLDLPVSDVYKKIWCAKGDVRASFVSFVFMKVRLSVLFNGAYRNIHFLCINRFLLKIKNLHKVKNEQNFLFYLQNFF